MKNIKFRSLCWLLSVSAFSLFVIYLVAWSGQAIARSSPTNESLQPRLILAGPPDASGLAYVQGFAGAVPANNQVTVVNNATNASGSTAANQDGSFRVSIPASAGVPLTVSCRFNGVENGSVTILTFSPAMTGVLPVISGPVNDLAVVGLSGYVAGATGLKIVDFTKQDHTAIVGSFITSTPATGVGGYHQYVFLTTAFNNTALRVLDVSNRGNPRQIASLFPASGGTCLAMAGYYPGTIAVIGGYIAGKGTGMQLADISDPTNPVPLGFARLDGSPQAIKVIDRFAYVAMGAAGVQVVDIGDPSSPVVVGSLNQISNVSRLALVPSPIGLMLAVPTNAGLKLFSLYNPVSPQLVSTALSGVATYDAALTSYGLVAVAIGGENSGVQLLSLRLPTLPRLYGSYRTDGAGARLAAAAGFLMLASTGNNPALTLFDTKAPFPPTPIYALPQTTTAVGIAISSSSSLIAANIRNVGLPSRHQLVWGDHSTPQKPALNETAEGAGTISAVAFSPDERWALIGSNDGSELHVLDTSRHELIGQLTLPFGARINAIKTRGSMAYLACGEGGLFIVDLGENGLPQLIGVADTPGGAQGLDINGNFVYIADNLKGLQVVDIANPAAPRLVATINTPGAGQDVRADGNQLFLAYATLGASNGLGIYDLTNPAQPNLVGKVATNGYASRVDVAGDLVYLASADAGLVIIDARNPRQPVVSKNIKTAGVCRDVKAGGAMVYIADDNALEAAIAISPLAQP